MRIIIGILCFIESERAKERKEEGENETEFNHLPGKYPYIYIPIFILLFKSYCRQRHGPEQWGNFKGSLSTCRMEP